MLDECWGGEGWEESGAGGRGQGCSSAVAPPHLPPAPKPAAGRSGSWGLSREALGKVSVLSHGKDSTGGQLLAELLRQVPAALGMLRKVFPSPSSRTDSPLQTDTGPAWCNGCWASTH